jgi:hypothetical protein
LTLLPRFFVTVDSGYKIPVNGDQNVRSQQEALFTSLKRPFNRRTSCLLPALPGYEAPPRGQSTAIKTGASSPDQPGGAEGPIKVGKE